MGKVTCRHVGCVNPTVCRELCKYHYEVRRRVELGKVCATTDCDGMVVARGLCTRCYSKQYKRRSHTSLCEHCGKTVVKRQARGRFCSTACAQAWRSVRRDVRAQLDHDDGLHETKCVVCSKAFMVAVWNCTTCSDECTQRLKAQRKLRARSTRRVREISAYVEDVNPQSVFEADGYRCHICGQMTDKDERVPHPRAPTVDHVLPLAKGGLHALFNVRTACFICNSTKGDRGGGEQFALTFQ